MRLRRYYREYQAGKSQSLPLSREESLGYEKLVPLIPRFAPADVPVSRVLDVGCGAGLLGGFLEPDAHVLIGLELNPELARRAAERYDGLALADLDEPWPLAEGCVEVVVARNVLEHVFDYHHLLNEANRVLVPEGVLAVVVPNLSHWRDVRKLLLGKQPHWGRSMQHLHVWTKRFLCELLEAHGFSRLWVDCDQLRLPFLRTFSWAWLERVWARWGNLLIVASRKVREVRVVDSRLAHRYTKSKHLNPRWIEVLR